MWEQIYVPSCLLFPPRLVPLTRVDEDPGCSGGGNGEKGSRSNRRRRPHVMIPRHAETLLTCWYGNWHIYTNETDPSRTTGSKAECAADAARRLGRHDEAENLLAAYEAYHQKYDEQPRPKRPPKQQKPPAEGAAQAGSENTS